MPQGYNEYENERLRKKAQKKSGEVAAATESKINKPGDLAAAAATGKKPVDASGEYELPSRRAGESDDDYNMRVARLKATGNLPKKKKTAGQQATAIEKK